MEIGRAFQDAVKVSIVVALLMGVLAGTGLGAAIGYVQGGNADFENGFYQGVWASCLVMTRAENPDYCRSLVQGAIDSEAHKDYEDEPPIPNEIQPQGEPDKRDIRDQDLQGA
jgi:hypothetical protein